MCSTRPNSKLGNMVLATTTFQTHSIPVDQISPFETQMNHNTSTPPPKKKKKSSSTHAAPAISPSDPLLTAEAFGPGRLWALARWLLAGLWESKGLTGEVFNVFLVFFLVYGLEDHTKTG